MYRQVISQGLSLFKLLNKRSKSMNNLLKNKENKNKKDKN